MDLKRSDQSWDNAFTSHVFTPHQCELMDNFNLWYECLDGRDNFHTQMRKGAGVATSLDSDTCNEMDQPEGVSFDGEQGSSDMPIEEITVSNTISPRQRRMLNFAKEMTDIMQQQGWGRPIVNGLAQALKKGLEHMYHSVSARFYVEVCGCENETRNPRSEDCKTPARCHDIEW